MYCVSSLNVCCQKYFWCYPCHSWQFLRVHTQTLLHPFHLDGAHPSWTCQPSQQRNPTNQQIQLPPPDIAAELTCQLPSSCNFDNPDPVSEKALPWKRLTHNYNTNNVPQTFRFSDSLGNYLTFVGWIYKCVLTWGPLADGPRSEWVWQRWCLVTMERDHTCPTCNSNHTCLHFINKI